MIHVDKDYDRAPGGPTSKTALEKRKTLLKEGSRHRFSDHVYGHDSVRGELRKVYRNKCAYCEGRTSHGSAPRVDHYRPKKKVKNEDGHPGYYWLAYEWSNLVHSCEKCNGIKSNHFPVQGKRVSEPGVDPDRWLADSETLLKEEPLLLNPELDRPEDHLVFLPNGSVMEKNGSPGGRRTIEVCGLEREDLRIERKRLVDEFDSAFGTSWTSSSPSSEKENTATARNSGKP